MLDFYSISITIMCSKSNNNNYNIIHIRYKKVKKIFRT